MTTQVKCLAFFSLFLLVSPAFAIQEKPLHPKLQPPPQPTQHALNRPTPMPTPERKPPQPSHGNATNTMSSTGPTKRSAQ